LKQSWWYDGRRDIIASTEAALSYLEKLHKRFNGDWLLAIAAYNSGGGRVSKAIKTAKRKGKPTDFWNLSLPKETEAYVPRLLALSKLFFKPEDYKLDLARIPNQAVFEEIAIGSQIDLAQAAALAGLTMDEFYRFNPAYNKWATDPSGPHTLLVPYERADEFRQKLKELSPEQNRELHGNDTRLNLEKHFLILHKPTVSMSRH
jgi:membrane-bound lytic murein transglycosylase D